MSRTVAVDLMPWRESDTPRFLLGLVLYPHHDEQPITLDGTNGTK